MKILGKTLILAIIGLVFLATAPVASADQYVNGYTRSNGTYVNGYYRSSPDGNPYNNYSYPGNYNPYTGKTATGNASTYLRNYYDTSYSTYSSPSYNYTPSVYSTYTPSYGSYYGGSSSYQTSVEDGYKIGDSLFCNTGYYKKSDKCIKAPNNSTAYGSENFYCDTGYKKAGDSCKKPENGTYLYDGDLSCDEGYILSSNGKSCLKPVQQCKTEYGEGASYNRTTQKCVCSTGNFFDEKSNKCITHRKICKLEFGSYSVPSGEESCVCREGYALDSNKKCARVK